MDTDNGDSATASVFEVDDPNERTLKNTSKPINAVLTQNQTRNGSEETNNRQECPDQRRGDTPIGFRKAASCRATIANKEMPEKDINHQPISDWLHHLHQFFK
jgi:hypothetical protein